MAYYGVIFPEFWTGHTGRAIRQHGGKDAQLLGAYLFSNAHVNMLGLYQLPVDVIRAELKLSPSTIAKAFAVFREEAYAFYDDSTSYVWVREMARFRLRMTNGVTLKGDDNKVIGARKLYASLSLNPWLGPFFDRYGQALHLYARREGTPLDVGLPRGLEGASKGLASQ